jgi:hypothetical protein
MGHPAYKMTYPLWDLAVHEAYIAIPFTLLPEILITKIFKRVVVWVTNESLVLRGHEISTN